MVNYACAFSQSESGKYFEWIINVLIERISIHNALFMDKKKKEKKKNL